MSVSTTAFGFFISSGFAAWAFCKARVGRRSVAVSVDTVHASEHPRRGRRDSLPNVFCTRAVHDGNEPDPHNASEHPRRGRRDSLPNAFCTRAVHDGNEPDPQTGGVCVPINLSTTFAQSKLGTWRGSGHPSSYGEGFDYGRSTNPTRNSFERCIASIEGAKYCIAYSSGVSALSAVIHCCKHGDHIICCDDAYSGTQRLLRTIAAPIYNISSSYVDFNEDGKLAAEIFKFPNTTLIMFETPSNPTLKLIDFKTVVKAVQRKHIFTMCDSTFMSPAGQSPLTFGIDMVVHSTTKYVNGHSDVLGGVVCTNNDNLKKKLRHYQNACGCVLSPFDSYLVLRGVKTLSLRMDRHESNALKLASWLEQHPQVESVRYPGLQSHPQHDLACKQMFSFGGMIAFKIKGGLKAARTFLNRVKVFTLAESLGAVESLIESPALMTHHNVPEERLREAGVAPNLIRVSVGIEAIEDLIQDLDAAFKGIETCEF